CPTRSVLEPLRVPLLRLRRTCSPGVQSLKSPTTETGPGPASRSRTKVTLTPVAAFLRRIMFVSPWSVRRQTDHVGRSADGPEGSGAARSSGVDAARPG